MSKSPQAPLLPAEDDFDPEEPATEATKPTTSAPAAMPMLGDKSAPELEVRRIGPPYPSCVLHTTVNNGAGEWVDVKVQSDTFEDALTTFAALVQNLSAEFGVTMARPTTQAGAAHPAPQAPTEPKAPSAHAQSGNANTGSAVMPITRIVVVPRDKGGFVTQFHVKPFKWPLQCYFDAENTASLFDEELGWLPEHFDAIAEYTGQVVDGLFLLWIEETNQNTGKTYKNVKRVSADKESLDQMVGG